MYVSQYSLPTASAYVISIISITFFIDFKVQLEYHTQNVKKITSDLTKSLEVPVFSLRICRKEVFG